MSIFDKKIVKTNNTTSKNFDYSKGDVSLKFSLRTDIKQQLKDFSEILKVAILEVDNEIAKIDAPVHGSGFGEGQTASG